MPNLLAHCGVQGVLTHALIKGAPPAWITVGCLIPDVPWILARMAKIVILPSAAYDVQLYAIVQATLALSLLLAAGLAFLSRRPGWVFRILAFNVVVHLLLDASQIKWSSGVHFFAPFTWTLRHWGWFWPESLITVLCTVAGVVYLLWALRHPSQPAPTPALSRTMRHLLATVFLVIYFLLPFALWHGPYAADNHFIKTLHERDAQSGRPIELDRANYVPRVEGDRIYNFAGEGFKIQGYSGDRVAKLSVKGKLLDAETIRIDQAHVHWPHFRDWASYIGLIWLGALWSKSWWQQCRHPGPT